MLILLFPCWMSNTGLGHLLPLRHPVADEAEAGWRWLALAGGDAVADAPCAPLHTCTPCSDDHFRRQGKGKKLPAHRKQTGPHAPSDSSSPSFAFFSPDDERVIIFVSFFFFFSAVAILALSLLFLMTSQREE